MMNTVELKQTPLGKGIQFIGIGKHGSKDLPETLVEEIIEELRQQKADFFQKGAFFGALRTKGMSRHEFRLERAVGEGVLSDPEALYEQLCSGLSPAMKPIGVKLLSMQTLDEGEAFALGTYLFSNQPGEAFRGMAASVLRIRYETEAEYQGLIRAAQTTYAENFRQLVPAGKKIVQLAEPFDGVEHSYLITPLLANALQREGYTVISTTGRSGGPKLTLNALNLYEKLGSSFVKGNADLLNPAPRFGWALRQQDLSPALDAWVDRRHHLIKRPFLATMEKVLNPAGAQILITSVFHITYLEKMVELAGMTGFTGVIVLKRGLEGTLAPSIARASGILCAAKGEDGDWLFQSFEADTMEFASFRATEDAVIENLTAEDNAALVNAFADQGKTGNEDFDKRVNLGIALYQKGLAWIEEKIKWQ